MLFTYHFTNTYTKIPPLRHKELRIQVREAILMVRVFKCFLLDSQGPSFLSKGCETIRTLYAPLKCIVSCRTNQVDKKLSCVQIFNRAGSGSGRIRIHLGPWIRIQRYKTKGKAEFNQQLIFFS